MKKLITILLVGLLFSCNSNTEKDVNDNEPKSKKAKTSAVKKDKSKPLKSGDYSTLLTDFKCNMDISELAKVLGVPESDLGVPKHPTPKKCNFSLKGFGKNSANNDTHLKWGIVKSSKKRNKSEINNYLKKQDDYAANPKVYQYMSMSLADTKDCYIAHQPSHGRVIIYNENYENAFILNYEYRGAFKRTIEQQLELRDKMTDLANYLLKKHRK